jgi:dihydroorotase
MTPQESYDLVLRGGHVIDPGRDLSAVRDVAIAGGRIARVASDLSSTPARRTLDVRGLYVTPGLIDLHVHVYLRARQSTLWPDDTSLLNGVTTAVDAGTSGPRTFDDFKATVIDKAKTRILAHLNIVGQGMRDGSQGESNEADMDPAAVAAKIRQYPDIIVGVKTAHYRNRGFTALKRAVEAGRLADRPVFVDNSILSGEGRTTREKLLDIMRPGDLHTHMYNDGQIELLDRRTGRLTEVAREARRRGVLFDMGHGGGGFLWPIAAQAMEQGFPPDTISTDLHPNSIQIPQVSMPNCISKLMALGMTLDDAVRRATVNPAKAIRRYPEFGTLVEGRAADIAVFELRTGVFALIDSRQKKRLASQKLECVLTLRNGEVVFDRDGLSFRG